MGGQVPVQHIDAVGHPAVTAMPRAGRGLQQRRPLPQHLVVIRTHSRDPWPARGREFMCASLAQFPHERGIFGGERHRAPRTEHLACGADG